MHPATDIPFLRQDNPSDWQIHSYIIAFDSEGCILKGEPFAQLLLGYSW